MCGITGIFPFNIAGRLHMINLSKATHSLTHRGPDAFGTHIDESIGLGHRRLSIIDLSEDANQPMKDESERYIIIFNGEIYNYKELRKELESKGVGFRTQSDTEVLLQCFIQYGSEMLQKLNGFFAFAIFDCQKEELFVARDRFGIKPLYYLYDEDKFLFASELQSIISFGIEKKMDLESLYTYFQLNYIPAPDTIFQNIKMLMPGNYMWVRKQEMEIHPFYQIDYNEVSVENNNLTYEQQKEKLSELIDTSVRRRLVADVPVGTFLSGGIDSSVITGIAKKYKNDLHTFSIGYSDEPYFDETKYANLVAKKFGTEHTVFSLSKKEIEDELFHVLENIDQPFADSSAIPVYILSKRTREHITVALSGDGADELFSGYNKHSAFHRAAQSSITNSLLKNFSFLTSILPKSRSTALTNKFRQLDRFSKSLQSDIKSRYWQWASLGSEKLSYSLFSESLRKKLQRNEFYARKEFLLKDLKTENLNEVLLTDMNLVLPNDMLKKVDLMSMAHGLEVRVPFLDHEVVNFVFSLPAESKINGKMRKRILQDAYKELLPAELYNRPKQGFEVPLLRWFRGSLSGLIRDDLLKDNFIAEQGLFDTGTIKNIKKKLFSISPGDVHAHIWALIVFQYWWKKHFN